jgi:NTE family protein
MTDITLALGGGGSKGYAHLGVIRSLLDLGFNIKGIAGSSAGGMAGAVFAAGFHPEMVLEGLSELDQEKLYGFGVGPGLLNPSGIHSMLERFLGETTFDELEIPCAVTAVDLNEMKEVTIQEGNVLEAVKATTAIPGLFPPVLTDPYQLIDGMVLNPIPVAIARSLAPRLPVVAVSLSPPPEQWQKALQMDTRQASPLLRPISRLRIAKAFDIYSRSSEMTLFMLAEIRLQAEGPDVVIRPDVFHIGSLDRVDIKEVANFGDQAVQSSLPALKKLKKRSRWSFFRN